MFEVKVRYQKIDEKGKEKTVTELYLVEAVSFSDAEEQINKELEPYISGEFAIISIKIANYSELLHSEEFDKWFKTKITFTTVDEERGLEKETSTYILVQAEIAKQVIESVNTAFNDDVSSYDISSISETKILDIFYSNK